MGCCQLCNSTPVIVKVNIELFMHFTCNLKVCLFGWFNIGSAGATWAVLRNGKENHDAFSDSCAVLLISLLLFFYPICSCSLSYRQEVTRPVNLFPFPTFVEFQGGEKYQTKDYSKSCIRSVKPVSYLCCISKDIQSGSMIPCHSLLLQGILL